MSQKTENEDKPKHIKMKYDVQQGGVRNNSAKMMQKCRKPQTKENMQWNIYTKIPTNTTILLTHYSCVFSLFAEFMTSNIKNVINKLVHS
jgi:hypothetical protein